MPYFNGNTLETHDISLSSLIYPNPVEAGYDLFIKDSMYSSSIYLYDLSGRKIQINRVYHDTSQNISKITIPESTSAGIYVLNYNNQSIKIIVTN